MTWDDVLNREDLIGGDIESIESHVPYRGPISKIERQGAMIVFTSPWCARMNTETGEWEKWSVLTSSINGNMFEPQDIGNGRVFFMDTCPFPTRNTLFPKRGGSKLDADKVKGLPKAFERLLALYPDLPFDREVVGRMLIEKTCLPVDELSHLLPEATLLDLLAMFRRDDSKEEFLWHYIEFITQDKGVHLRVY